MTTLRSRRSRTRAALLGAALVAVLPVLSGCAGTREYPATPLPTTPQPSSAAPPAAAVTCDNALSSYDPVPLAQAGSSTALQRIKARGRLVVGVSADTLLFGARDARTGQLKGFDIDLARAVAAAVLGSPDRLELRVIDSGSRVPFLLDGTIDMVARTMTITCARWQQIAFSAQYFEAGQRILVADTSPITSVQELGRKRVCAPTASTSLDNLRRLVPTAIAVPAATHSACLILFQQGKVDAITGDDAVLAGLTKQDPYAKMVGPRFSEEPYGLGLPPNDPAFVGVVNSALSGWIASGGWASSYRTWLAATLGATASPPAPVYGRR